jgi:hypothetical protein
MLMIVSTRRESSLMLLAAVVGQLEGILNVKIIKQETEREIDVIMIDKDRIHSTKSSGSSSSGSRHRTDCGGCCIIQMVMMMIE